ncbi:hypothetical protein CTheo_6833 [Ceratobasidium theobromae]|uniref:Uncharacterized protein n=1 Tax=Ceratobasidium theobromae TaxID=1582974 RepID=A0A5N5QEG9_9AGAM|nr:hypothetical protein CTheo_6833 [Ceratobasidium theobromae]
MPTADPMPSPAASDDGFDSCSEGVNTPIEPLSVAHTDAKDIASGVVMHSPPAFFVGTPFATSTGPNALFEYPFPPARPALSTASSISSVASAFGPPSPTTRAKHIPRTSQHPSRRFSGNSPPHVRIPPRLRTDSNGSAASAQSQTTDESGSAKTPKTAPGAYTQRPRPSRLRDRSGSLGIQLPPPISTIGADSPPAGPVSPVLAGGITLSPRSDGEACLDQGALAASGKRRASVPALFAPRLTEEDTDQT